MTPGESGPVITAFAAWGERIAPVFDVCRELHLVESAGGRIERESTAELAEELPARLAARLAELGVGTLVCGAISRPLEVVVAAYGIRIVCFVTGQLRQVIEAYLTGRLDTGSYAMPGCCGAGRGRQRRGHGPGEEWEMLGRGRGGGVGGKGRGQGGRGRGAGAGQGGRGPGRMGGPKAAGPVGFCVCPACGHRCEHVPGRPCAAVACPECGAAMVRE